MSLIIRTCSIEHEVAPMLYTFAFRGAEYWCPICGRLGGMLDGGSRSPATPELIAFEKAYRKRAESFLEYRASLSGAMVIGEDGKTAPLMAEQVDYEYNKPIILKENS